MWLYIDTAVPAVFRSVCVSARQCVRVEPVVSEAVFSKQTLSIVVILMVKFVSGMCFCIVCRGVLYNECMEVWVEAGGDEVFVWE